MVIDSRAERTLPAPPERVWDWMWAPANARWFTGAGPVAAVERVEVDALAVGAVRRVYTSDGAALNEELLEVDRPRRQVYRLTGIAGPFAWLVRSGESTFTYHVDPGGTRVEWTYRFTLTTPWVWPLARPVISVFGVAQRRSLAAIAAGVA